jgi:hypothetical protein
VKPDETPVCRVLEDWVTRPSIGPNWSGRGAESHKLQAQTLVGPTLDSRSWSRYISGARLWMAARFLVRSVVPMSLSVTSEDDAFVFGAYAAHLKRTLTLTEPLDAEEQDRTSDEEATLETVDPVSC